MRRFFICDNLHDKIISFSPFHLLTGVLQIFHLPHRLRAALANLRDLPLTELPLVQVLQNFLRLGFVQELVVGLCGVFGSPQLSTLH